MDRIQIFALLFFLGIGFIYYYHSLILLSLKLSVSTIIMKSSSFKLVAALRKIAEIHDLPHFNLTINSEQKPVAVLYKTVTMNDRLPHFKLATMGGQKPYADGDRAQATVVASLQLIDKCKQDPSLIVVDVGALLGDFGLYAAACGCQVFMFEVQPNYVDLIRTSIALNNFSTTRVQVLQKAVSNLPSNSSLTFSPGGGETTALGGTLRVSTIRLDDVPWPAQSTIIMLKIDVEGFELNVLRSAEKLFGENRIHHVIFEYTAWWTDRAAQQDVLPYVQNTLRAKQLFALHRTDTTVYGPLSRRAIEKFHENHLKYRLQTDVYARFVTPNRNLHLTTMPYHLHNSVA